MYANPKIDLVIALGLIASQEAARHSHRSKPTFAPFPVDVAMQGLPYVDGASGVRNFNYLATNIDTRQSLEAFRELVPFQHLALLVNAELARAVPGFTRQAEAAAQELGIELDVIPVGSSVPDALGAIGPGVDAVFITPLLQLSGEEFKRLAQGLIERRLPSFSLLGEGEVRAGILAGIRPHSDWRRMARRVALNAQRSLLGEDPANLPVENIELLTRYGSEDSEVALDRLGGGAWQARKAKMKRRILEMAGELIKVAAQRFVRKAPALQAPEGQRQELHARCE